jgi:quercetin 2,3-dioxygenase
MATVTHPKAGIDIRRSADRHETQIEWLHGRHSFDTGIDAFGADTHHGLLVVNNHDTIAPASGFGTHPHRNLEIVTWVLDGSVVQQDSEGHAGAIYPNLAQRMTAGRGIRHSEKNDHPAGAPHAGRPLELVQMWVAPDEADVAPGYEQLELDPADLHGKLLVLASGMARDRDATAIRIHNRNAALQVTRLDVGQVVTIPEAPYGHLYVARGVVDLEEAESPAAGDAARLTDAGARRLVAKEASEVLFWEMHATLA